MYEKLLAVALMQAFVVPAFADNGSSKWFVVGDVGKSYLNGDSGSDQGFGLGAGYRLNEMFSVEAGYRFLGSDTRTFKAADGSTQSASYRIRALQLSAVGELPLGQALGIFGRLGANSIQEKYHYADARFEGSLKARNSGLLVGVGVNYHLTPSATVRVEYQKPASNLYLLSAGLKYAF